MSAPRLAVALLIAVAGCTADLAPTQQSDVAPGAKRWTTGASRHTSVKARPRPRRLQHRVSRNLSRRPVAPPWDALAQCESGSNWQANTGNGYYGGLQENLGFWRNYGGVSFAARPDLASRHAQIVVAERGLAAQGWGAWPVCSVRVGLR